MADLTAVQLALFDRLEALTLSPPLEIDWPEPPVTFVPPADGRYLEVRFFPNVPAFQGLGGETLDQGLFQINVVWPKNQGEIAPGQIAKAVRAHFAVPLALFHGGTKTKITGTQIAAALKDATELRIPVTISWTA